MKAEEAAAEGAGTEPSTESADGSDATAAPLSVPTVAAVATAEAEASAGPASAE